jgi:hypothetical protein
VYDRVERYVSELYCPAIAADVLPPLMYSGVLQQFVDREEDLSTRFRLNVMLQWPQGWFKSSILLRVASWFPFESNEVTGVSTAALRGSFVDKQFYVPEMLLSDLMVFPELTTVLKGDDETVAALLSALEEGVVRVVLIKAVRLNDAARREVARYGATFTGNRLRYRNRAIVWTATHTVDNVPPDLRDAFLARFHVCSVNPSSFPDDVAWHRPVDLVDRDFEQDVALWVDDLFPDDPVEPDVDFVKDVMDALKARHRGRRGLLPRDVGNVDRMAYAHRVLFPADSVGVTARKLERFLGRPDIGGRTTRERIANAIFRNPMSARDILRAVPGLQKANLFGHLNRMKARHREGRPRHYYLDSLPPVRQKKTKPRKNELVLNSE